MRYLLMLAITVAIVAAAIDAAIPNQTPEQLQKHAEQIVIGKVQAVYTRVKESEQWRHTVGVVELAVTGVEKGQRINEGDVVYVRFWRQQWIGEGEPPPFGAGHVVPEEGAAVRAFLKQNDGVYEPLLPNGLVPLKAQP